jgi:hypothetical protein
MRGLLRIETWAWCRWALQGFAELENTELWIGLSALFVALD